MSETAVVCDHCWLGKAPMDDEVIPAVCVACKQPILDQGVQWCEACIGPEECCTQCGKPCHQECMTKIPYWGEVCPECAKPSS